jgi:hypothetical protein
MSEANDSTTELRHLLDTSVPGAVSDLPGLTDALSRAWPDLAGSSETRMGSWKLGRIESPSWNPPVLSFTIERHGGTMLGSTRAELQTWEVDLDQRTACVAWTTHRQLKPMAPRLKTAPLGTEIIDLIEAGADDPRLQWSPDRATVRVLVEKVIPPNGYARTIEGRRRRFTDSWAAAMTAAGWEQDGPRVLSMWRHAGTYGT